MAKHKKKKSSPTPDPKDSKQNDIPETEKEDTPSIENKSEPENIPEKPEKPEEPALHVSNPEPPLHEKKVKKYKEDIKKYRESRKKPTRLEMVAEGFEKAEKEFVESRPVKFARKFPLKKIETGLYFLEFLQSVTLPFIRKCQQKDGDSFLEWELEEEENTLTRIRQSRVVLPV